MSTFKPRPQTHPLPIPADAPRANFRLKRGGANLVLEIATPGSVSHAKLSTDDALSLALMLTYEARERLAAAKVD